MKHGVDYWRCKCGHVSLPNYHTGILPGVCKVCSRKEDGSAPFVTSPRHGFRCDRVPRQRNPVWGGSSPGKGVRDQGPVMDCVYEMAAQIATGNGWPVNQAIEQILKDEGWALLPTQKREICNRIADDRLELILLRSCAFNPRSQLSDEKFKRTSTSSLWW